MIFNRQTSILKMFSDFLKCVFSKKKPNISFFEIGDQVLISNSFTTIRWSTDSSFAVSIYSDNRKVGIFNKRGSRIISTNDLGDHLKLKSYGISESAVAIVPVKVLNVKKQTDLDNMMVNTPKANIIPIKPLFLPHLPILIIPFVKKKNKSIRCELPKVTLQIPTINKH